MGHPAVLLLLIAAPSAASSSAELLAFMGGGGGQARPGGSAAQRAPAPDPAPATRSPAEPATDSSSSYSTAPPPTPARPPAACGLRRVDVRTLSMPQFRTEFQGRMPVLLTHVTGSWAATTSWASVDAVVRAHGAVQVPLQDPVLLGSRGTFAPVLGNISLKQYLADDRRPGRRPAFHNRPHALTDALLADTNIATLPMRALRIHHILSLGQEGTGVGLHSHSEGWLAQVTGRKGWYLTDSLARSAFIKDKHGCELFHKPPREGVDQCVVAPGEALYLPADWYHATCNLDQLTVSFGGQGELGDLDGRPELATVCENVSF